MKLKVVVFPQNILELMQRDGRMAEFFPEPHKKFHKNSS